MFVTVEEQMFSSALTHDPSRLMQTRIMSSIHLLLLIFFLSQTAALRMNNDSIWDFNFENDAAELEHFRYSDRLVFFSAEIEDLTLDVLEPLASVRELRFRKGSIRTAWLPEFVETFSIHNAETKELMISVNQNYNVVSLLVVGCLLDNVPENIGQLSALRTLDLGFNQIEQVNMDLFSGLSNLEALSLRYNKIFEIRSPDVFFLPALKSLMLNSNKLEQLDICGWNMDHLEYLRLDNNNLQYVVNILDQFPVLQEIALTGNLMNCDWKNKLLEDISKTEISYDGPWYCDPELVTPAPDDCPSRYMKALLKRQAEDISSLRRDFKQQQSIIDQMSQTILNLQVQQVEQYTNLEAANQKISDVTAQAIETEKLLTEYMEQNSKLLDYLWISNQDSLQSSNG
ncbi:SLIT and NTRK-like protein 1 isoform X2 [Uranotaenia lowii]|uniref:SLIT and NTRK-like protein 1 isoform X2 n=1 Tax=Uranotaenia lowii TaxID=190385 RepID=UPI00247A247A|nr:SLIT and NTRK-like protein 1 isoform X2 [Uranotaenia lowii]